jgi:hypothetical protein
VTLPAVIADSAPILSLYQTGFLHLATVYAATDGRLYLGSRNIADGSASVTISAADWRGQRVRVAMSFDEAGLVAKASLNGAAPITLAPLKARTAALTVVMGLRGLSGSGSGSFALNGEISSFMALPYQVSDASLAAFSALT